MGKISEDWMSVIIGLGIVVLVWISLLGKPPWPLFGLF
jgi:hypothetical protein